MGVKRSKNRIRLPLKAENIDIEAEPIPIEFDERKYWPNCPSVSLIRDQGECGLCWVVAATEFMSDRICVNSNGTKQVNISAQHLNYCFTECGIGFSGDDIIAALKYYRIDETSIKNVTSLQYEVLKMDQSKMDLMFLVISSIISRALIKHIRIIWLVIIRSKS